MEKFRNYKEYFIDKEIWRTKNKIENLKELLKMKKKDFEELKSWEQNRYHGYLTNKQSMLLSNGNFKELKILLKKQIEKENKKIIIEKEKAIEKYNKIKELKDIKKASIEIIWGNSRGAYGFQCYATGRVWYKNGDFEQYETSKTGGCGYDKSSTALSRFCNELLKIVILKNNKKILNDDDKHYHFYACEPLYFQYGVGLSSYQTMFKNLGYKANFRYLSNENILIDIEK